MNRHRSPAEMLRDRPDRGFSLYSRAKFGPPAKPRRHYRVTNVGEDTKEAENSVRVNHALDEDPRIRQMRAEAVLLVSKSPLSLRKLAQLAHLADATEARTLVRQLNRIYETHGRAIRVEQVAGGYRLLTRPALSPWLARLGHLPAPLRLSTPMMETLSVVAYRQPVSRANAEAVRGVACGEILRQLMERDLIRIVGRSEELGRPYLYGTTKRFLKLFGLTSVEALPPIQWQALREDPPPEDLPNDTQDADSNLDQSSTSTKEPVVSTAAPVLEATVEMDSQDPTLIQTSALDPNPSSGEASAVLEDEENGAHYTDEDDDDEWGDTDDDDDIDDDWDDDDLDEEDEFDDEDDDLDDELDEKEEDDDWEEVDDVDIEDDDWDDENEDDEEEDDEDWD